MSEAVGRGTYPDVAADVPDASKAALAQGLRDLEGGRELLVRH